MDEKWVGNAPKRVCIGFCWWKLVSPPAPQKKFGINSNNTPSPWAD